MKTYRMNTSVRWLFTTWLLLAMILTLAGPGASVARAASYVVTDLNDSGTGSLRQAISDANASAGADTITFNVSGTIVLSSTLFITDAAGLTIDGVGQSITVSGNDAVRVLFVSTGAALALRHLTVAGGNADNANVGGGMYNGGTLSVADSTFSGNRGYWGGGIFNVGTLSVADSTFSGNTGQERGAAIFNYITGTLTVTNSTFSGNTGFIGGGIYNQSGTLEVTDSTFSENVGTSIMSEGGPLVVTNSTFLENHGGGIYNNGTLHVTGSTFSGNDAFDGGGIYNYYDGTVSVTDSTFSGNNAHYYGGGGIYSWGALSVTDSTFSGNTAETVGGGIEVFDDTATVINSTFSGNSAHIGGAIHNNPATTLDVTNSIISGNSAEFGGGIFSSGTLDVSDSTFSGNTAEGSGGGIYATDAASITGTATVTNSTFSNNSAAGSYLGGGGGIFNTVVLDVTNSTLVGNSSDTGGGIYSYGTLTVTNSTFSENNADNGGGIYNNTATATLKNTIVADSPTGGNCTNSDGSLIDGGGNLSWPDTTCPGLNADPLLGSLQHNGGPTQTQALLPGSPAIDAAVLANCPATDQRGVSRPQGAGCDIGAFELEMNPLYNFSGFFPPVDNLPTLNVVKAGSGIPVKFSLSGDQGLDIFAAGYPISQQIACDSGTPQGAIEETSTAGSSGLSYNAASDTYTYLWKTSKSWAATCRQLIIRLNDGTEHQANFQFVR